MRRMLTRALLMGAMGLIAGGAVGCAQERSPINRVQANALAKSFFVGKDLTKAEDDPEFHMRGTVIDVGYGAAQDGLFTATYAMPVSRIRWQITEDALIARLAYERIKDSDGKGNVVDGYKKKAVEDGQVVAVYRIESHFDIRRSYNPSTGEESNVVEENSSDRPWYQREYMRVDWSQNRATDVYDYDTLSMLGIYGGINYESIGYAVTDPNDPDAPHFDAEQGYFDVTNKAYATPAVIDLSSLGWGIDKFPACYLPGEFAGGTEPYGNCNPTEITLRYSFKKVIDTDYEPLDYDGYRFQMFGIFDSNYKGYQRDYGMVDEKWFRFANRYNPWKRSHFYTNPDEMTGAIQCDVPDAQGVRSGNPNADENNNGTADQCEGAGLGSQCDVFKGKCTLPYQKRDYVTIPWYINGGTTSDLQNLEAQLADATDAGDTAKQEQIKAQIAEVQKKGEDLFEATNWAVEEWDLAMRTAVQTAKLTECRRTGGVNCESQFPMWNGQQDDIDEAVDIVRDVNACWRKNGWEDASCAQTAHERAKAVAAERGTPDDASTLAIGDVTAMRPAIVLCHNPVIKGDHPACGAEGLTARVGDLRYNSVHNIDKPQQPSAWGIMVDAEDPITGEKVAASINIWTHVTDVASQGLLDLVRYVNGEIPIDQITNGEYINNWVNANKVAAGGNGPTMSRDEIDRRVAAATKFDAQKVRDIVKNAPEQAKALVRQARMEMQDIAVGADMPSQARTDANMRMKRARGSNVEAQLLNPAMLQAAGVKNGIPVDGAIADAASPLALNNPKVRSQLRELRENALAERGACILNEAPEASGVPALSAILKEKFPFDAATETPSDRQGRYNRMLSYIRRKYHYAVIAHEMGHSVGLRHNFVSNTAALFFRPQYWQLRTKNGTVKTECTDAKSVEAAAGCVGPRYFDPLTAEEQDQMIWMFQHSTVMDYPGDVSQDMVGLGVYDFAAARYFYGDTASVYQSENYKVGTKIGVGITNATDTFGGLVGIKYGIKGSKGGGANDFHYSQLQKNYTLIDRCYEVTPTQPAWWREDVDGKWHPVMDGKIVTVDGKATKCRQQPVDYVAYQQLRMPTEDEVNSAFYRGGPSVDPNGRLRVPYAFATDRWADTGNVSVFRHDAGADPYEQTMFLITTQENRHIFDNYRRGRTTFNVRASADRSFGRYNEKLLGIGGGLGLYVGIYQDLATNNGYSFDSLWPLFVTTDGGFLTDNIIAATLAMDHFTRELSRPQIGGHYKRAAAYNDPVFHSDADTDDYGPGSPNGDVALTIPNGTTGFLKDVGIGGHALENGFSEDKGEYDTDYTAYAGSYYDKVNTAILLSESEDRFVSSSRRDFYDARFRAVGMADVLPEGYRRVIASALTNDRSLLASHVETDANGKPLVEDPNTLFPKRPLGWTSWWHNEGPQVCFPTDGKNLCSPYSGSNPFKPADVPNTAPVDPQVGWEVQKFMIAWTLAYIPANQKTNWTDMMRIFRVGPETPASFEQRIEWQDPATGEIFYARTYGKECLFGTVEEPSAQGKTPQEVDAERQASCESTGGKWVQKGIAARVLEYANWLTSKGYQLDTESYPNNTPDMANIKPGFNKYGRAMVMHHPDGNSIVVPDGAIKDWNSTGTGLVAIKPCDQNVDPACEQLSVNKNHYAYELKNYKSVPAYIWETGIRLGVWGDPHELGLYP